MSAPHAQVNTAPPTPREMAQIAIGLTVVCLLASILLGGVYLWTEPAKARNVAEREQRLIGELLGLSVDATVDEVRRYLVWRGPRLEVFYLGDARLVQLDADGRLLATAEVPAEIARSTANADKDAWVEAFAEPGEQDRFQYVGRFFAGRQGGAPAGYVIEGETIGFKTWIRFFLAVDPDYRLRGIEIIEHEEDPGLGDQIEEPYFKNQFAGRDHEAIADIEVTKDPLPKAWRAALEALAEQDLDTWLRAHAADLEAHPDIHAITGATISSVAVADGVKRALANFRKRMDLVEEHL
ncbi:MAG: FMN-binding protein [Gammaproteobacteria bacterium]|nr:FMN-binding protein [Gammaproteobacteria bacterium]